MVLFTRACAVWGGSKRMVISLALVYAVCATFLFIRERDQVLICPPITRVQPGAQPMHFSCTFKDFNISVRPSSPEYFTGLPGDQARANSLCIYTGLKIGNGCVYIIANNHIWYALVIHIACETRKIDFSNYSLEFDSTILLPVALILLLIKSVQHTRVMRHGAP